MHRFSTVNALTSDNTTNVSLILQCHDILVTPTIRHGMTRSGVVSEVGKQILTA